MEKLYIRGRLILLLREHALRRISASEEPEYAIDIEDLVDLVRGEFGVALPEEMMADLSSIEPVVDFIQEHAAADGR